MCSVDAETNTVVWVLSACVEAYHRGLTDKQIRSSDGELPEKYLLGIYLFNEEEFFECHDVLEELWADTMGESRLFIQGMIQAAVAMFHFGNENLGGARKMYHSAVEKLQQYPSPYMGIDLLRFLVDFEHCFQELLDAGETYPQGVELRDDRVPIIRLAEDDGQTEMQR